MFSQSTPTSPVLSPLSAPMPPDVQYSFSHRPGKASALPQTSLSSLPSRSQSPSSISGKHATPPRTPPRRSLTPSPPSTTASAPNPDADLPPISPISSMYELSAGSSSKRSSTSSDHTVPSTTGRVSSKSDHVPSPRRTSPTKSPSAFTPPELSCSQNSPPAVTLSPAVQAIHARNNALDNLRSVDLNSNNSMPRSISANTLDIPRGKVQILPSPRPLTPSPSLPSQYAARLPRPRVFIKQSSTHNFSVDPIAVTHPSPNTNDPVLITRHIAKPSAALETPPRHLVKSTSVASVNEDDYYFSDEEELQDGNGRSLTHTPGDVLSSKVRRAVSALRSISFQSHPNHHHEDLDTAWGQTKSLKPTPSSHRTHSSSASRWRRPRGRISSKNGVQEFDVCSEADIHSANSYSSNYSHRFMGRRDAVRAAPPSMHAFRARLDRRRRLWPARRRYGHYPSYAQHFQQNYQPAPYSDNLYASHQPLLAASTDSHLTPIPPISSIPLEELTRKAGTQRGSVDKYVEFIHASAQREAKNRPGRNFTGKFINIFRRR